MDSGLALRAPRNDSKMQWTDDAIVLGVRRHGEANAIAELFTRAHGRHLGLVHGGFGSRMRPVLQAGNGVSATWRARLDEHLGTYTVEPVRVRTATMFAAHHALFAVTHLAALARLLPERDSYEAIFDELDTILDQLDDANIVAAQVARFELRMLAELGFGLDLSSCAATGVTDELIYVSPKSGRAVSREGGEPWRDRLLRLPVFLGDPQVSPSADELAAGFALTGHFLERLVFHARGLPMPEARTHFLAAIGRLRSVA
jgi:DNA repair protein RecO (recombination protein O)